MRFNREKLYVAAAFLLLVFFTNAQPGCPAVNAGNNVNLPCGTSCTTLTAKPFDAGATTSYSVNSISYTPFSYTTGTNVLVNDDDIWSSVITLPFNFCFFGHVYNQAVIGANGIISFNLYRTGQFNNYDITGCNPVPDATPADSFCTNSIMCPYQDIDPELGGTIKYQIIGTAPCRIFVVSYNNIPLFDSDDPFSNCFSTSNCTSQVVIYETTNVIEIYIKNKSSCTDWNDGLAIEGIMDSTGTTAFTVPGRNLSVFDVSNDAYRFTPNGPSVVNVSWYQGATQISTDSVVTVCPSAPSTTYTAKAVYNPCAGGTPVTVTGDVVVTLAGTLDAGIDSFKNVSCFGLNDGKVYAHATSSNPPLTYGWSNGSTAFALTNLSPGTYTFTATDGAGCARSYSVTISAPAQLTAGVPNVTTTNCSGTGTGTLIAVPLGGTAPYTYNWTNGEQSVQDTLIAPGTYGVTVTDSTACTVTASGILAITVGANSVTLNLPTISNISCFGAADGSIAANATGGVTPYQYLWSNSQNTPAINNLSSGPYSISVTDAGGCTATATYSIIQPSALSINPPYIVNDFCGSVTAGEIIAQVSGGTAAYTYTWTEVSNSQAFTGDTIHNLPPDNYTLTVTDANGCTGNGSYQITQTPALLVTYDSTNVTCFDGSNGTAEAHVTTGTPPYLFSWDQNPSTTSDSTISGLSEGPVDIYVTDANNCIVDRIINITQPTQVGTQLVSVTNVSCNGGSTGSITVSGTGGTPGAYTFVWDDAVASATNPALPSGTYYVTATDVNGCTGNGSYSVTQPTALVINPATINNIGCGGGDSGSITAHAAQGTPGYTFNWQQQPAGQSYTGQTINYLPVGYYLLTVGDANNCKDTAGYSITAIPVLTFIATPTPASCFGGNNGGASVAVTSGTPPYQYSWDNGAYSGNSSINNLTAGPLKVDVTDANNCLADTTVVITQPTQLAISLVNPATEVNCNGGNNGELNVAATGGTQPYAFNWSNQFAGTDNTNLTAGPYTVVLVDFNDCADTANYVITQPTAIVANPTHINALCFTSADGSIDINPTGGVLAYSFNWSNGETTQVADGLTQGLYSCTITDAHGCSIIATDTIGQPAKIVLTQDSGIAVLCVGQKNGKLVVTATGGTPPYFYNATQDFVNFVSTTEGIIQGLDTGKYNIQIFDSLGCSVEYTGYVPPAIPDEFYAPVVDSTLCYGPDYNDGAALVLDSTVQNGPYQYSIDGGVLQDSGYFQNLSAGPHTITAVSLNGCISNIPVVVPEPLPIIAIVTPDTVTLPLGGSQVVQVTYLNATNPSYNWSPAMGLSCIDCPNPVVNAYTPGQYVVTVSMVNGVATCYGSTTLTVDILSHIRAFVPNAFSPNGDGNNDVFQIYGEDIKTVDLKVFNRWGEVVYTTTNLLAGWDGTYKGTLQMPGVYSYEAVITYLDDSQENKKGAITMIR